MKKTSQYKYHASFVSVDNHTYELHIESPSLTQDVEIKLGPDPIHISYSCEDMMAGAVGRTMSVQIVKDSLQLDDMFADGPLSVSCKLYKDSEIFFYGFLSNEEYDMPYSNDIECVTINVDDPIRASMSVPYSYTMGTKKKNISLVDIMEKFCNAVGLDKIYDFTQDRDRTYISETAFLPFECEKQYYESDDWKMWGDVLNFFNDGLNIYADADSLYLVKMNLSANCKTSGYADEYVSIAGAWTDPEYVQRKYIDKRIFADTDLYANMVEGSSSMSIIPAYTDVEVDVETREIDLIPDFSDLSRWSGTGLFTSMQTPNTLKQDDNIIKKYCTFHRNKGEKVQPYCYDWYGDFVLIKTFRYDGIREHEILDSIQIAALDIQMQDEATLHVDHGYTRWDKFDKVTISTTNNIGKIISTNYPVLDMGSNAHFYDDDVEDYDDGKERDPIGFYEDGTLYRYLIDFIGRTNTHIYVVNNDSRYTMFITSVKIDYIGSVQNKKYKISNTGKYNKKTFKRYLDWQSDLYATCCQNVSYGAITDFSIFAKNIYVYQATSLNSGINFAPFNHGTFNGHICQLIGADFDVRNAETQIKLIENSHTSQTS